MALLVKNRSFRLLFSATAVSNLGDGVSALAFPWLATLITRDPALVALVAFATTLPWLLFSVPVGVLVDRYDRRLLMVRADLFRLILTCGVISLIFSIPSFPPEGDPLLYILVLAALGMMLGTSNMAATGKDKSAFRIPEGAYGHAGWGGSTMFADPKNKLAFGYCMNRLGGGRLINRRGQSLIEACYKAIAQQNAQKKRHLHEMAPV